MTEEIRRCSVEGCERKLAAKGYCTTHYQRNRKMNSNEETVPLAETECFDIRSTEQMVTSQSVPLPYPGFENPPVNGGYDERMFAKYTANTAAGMLNSNPDHPKREEILKWMEDRKRIADMDDKDYMNHFLYQSNPLHKLTQDEKLHCIRTLPVSIVQKLFPHL